MHKERYLFMAAVFALLAVAALVYLPGLRGPFVFDDASNILHVHAIRLADLSFGSLQEAWHAREAGSLLARPIAMLSFGLNYYFTQFDVFYFKLTNLVIHLTTAISLYALTLILLRRHHLVSPSSPYEVRHVPWLAFAIVAAWLLHPLNLTSVLYVVQRMNSLSALFTVLGLIGYCCGRAQIIRGEQTGFATVLASLAIFGSLAVLCKENGVLLLPFAALIEITFYRFDAHASMATLFRRSSLAVFAFSLALALVVAIVQYDQWFSAQAYRFRDFTLQERLLTQSRVLWFYLRLILLPDIAQMGLYHDTFTLSRSLTEPITTLWAIIGLAGLIAGAVAARTRFPVVFFALGWFFVGHSIESSALPLEMVHEHRNYLPQYGILFGIIYFLCASYSQLGRTLRWRLGFLALYIALLGVGTHARSLQWEDPGSLYTREVHNHPTSARAHTMLGVWLHDHGLREDARHHLTIAASLTPEQAETFIRLVQQVYATSRQVPEEMMKELRYRLLHGRVSDVALWVYEPLLLITRDQASWHDRFIDLYAATISRPDLEFSTKRYEAVYRLLADNHAYRGRDHMALQYYERSRAITPHPYYDIAAAKIYADKGCYPEAKQLISDLRVRYPELAPVYDKRLRDVESALAQHRDLTSQCTL